MLDLPTYRCTPRKFGPVANSQGKCLQSTCEWLRHVETLWPSCSPMHSVYDPNTGCASMGVDIFFSMIFSYFLGTAWSKEFNFPGKSRSLIWPVKHDQRLKDHQFIRHPFWSSLIIHPLMILMVMLCHLCPRSSDNPSHSFLEFAFRPCHGRLPRLKYISTWMSLVPVRDGFFKIAGQCGSYFPLASHSICSITHPGLFSSILLCPT